MKPPGAGHREAGTSTLHAVPQDRQDVEGWQRLTRDWRVTGPIQSRLSLLQPRGLLAAAHRSAVQVGRHLPISDFRPPVGLGQYGFARRHGRLRVPGVTGDRSRPSWRPVLSRRPRLPQIATRWALDGTAHPPERRIRRSYRRVAPRSSRECVPPRPRGNPGECGLSPTPTRPARPMMRVG